MRSIVRPCPVRGLMSDNTTSQPTAIVIGRAGMDLYPDPDGCKTRDADSFTADLGGSAGNIAVAMARAGASVALLSGLSKDPVGDFVFKKLKDFGVDSRLITVTHNDERTSLALAEVCEENSEVVIYRNNPADLAFKLSNDSHTALENIDHLVITGTSLIDTESRTNTIEAMILARASDCQIWFDLDYRKFNWRDEDETRQVYAEAASYCDVIVGNEEEFAILNDNIDSLIEYYRAADTTIILKRGSAGSSLFTHDARLDSGVYPLIPLKPYGAGDSFLGNLLVSYHHSQDWQHAINIGSAAAAIVVSKRGCASVMPTPEEVEHLITKQQMKPTAIWS